MSKILKTILTVLLSVLCMSSVIAGIASCAPSYKPNEPPTGGTLKPGETDKVPVYWVEYVADGVSIGLWEYIHAGSEIIPPDVPEKKGYTGEWEEYELAGEQNITVNAIYTPITYTITYKVVKEKDGALKEYRGDWEYWTSTYGNFKYYIFPTEYNVESEGLKVSKMPEVDISPKYHEEFSSWYTDEACTQKLDNVIHAGMTGDLVLYAKYECAWIGPF